MPRGMKGSKRRSGGIGACTNSDFTLYDFAHSALPADKVSARSGRIKKGEANAWSTEVKQLCSGAQSGAEALTMQQLLPEDEADDAWYERDLAEFDSALQGNEQEEEKEYEDGVKAAVVLKKHSNVKFSGHKTRATEQTGSNENDGHVTGGGRRSYPIDVWFLIGQFVQPEDIGRFACICRATRVVTYSAQFWQNIYFRYYKPTVSTLPLSLSPATVDRVHGLKARVIRALHYLYSPWVERVLHATVQLDSLDGTATVHNFTALEGAMCLRHWYIKTRQGWSFYWTFCRPTAAPAEHAVSLLAAPDVAFNREAGLVVLHAAAPGFVQLSQATGLVLVRVGTSGVTGSMFGGSRCHKLQLLFHDAHYAVPRRPAGQGLGNGAAHWSTAVVVDPVLRVDVLHWWHPAYPTNK